MEPNIIDYYNELPNGVNVIDKMNIEFNELQDKYNKLKNKYDKIINKKNKYKIPYRISNSLQEFINYKYEIDFKLRLLIRAILEDNENGVEEICKEDDLIEDITIAKLKRGLFITQYKKYSLINKIVNVLDDFTKNKNKKWCKNRINTAFDSLNNKNTIYLTYNHMIDNIIEYIFNDLNEDVFSDCLPETYNELCHKITFTCDKNGIYHPDNCYGGLHNVLNYMICSKCNNLHNDNVLQNLCFNCE